MTTNLGENNPTENKNKKLSIFIICGETSGDLLGSKVVQDLQNKTNNNIIIHGLGGENLAKCGLNSMFDISLLSVIGFIDVIKNVFLFKELINKTANEIVRIKPDIILSIDSGGFCFRVCALAKQKLELHNYKAKFYHYVSPAVWAYGKERGEKLVKIYNAIFCFFSFELEYFRKYNLKAIHVNNPIIKNYKLCNTDNNSFKLKYSITKPIIVITLGSRMSEIKIHSKIIQAALFLDARKNNMFHNYHIVFLTLPQYYGHISKVFENFNNITISTNVQDKESLLKEASFGIAKSGTNVSEFLINEIKVLVFYKLNWINYIIAKTFIKAKFANIINIINDKMIIPELVQSKCTPQNILKEFENIINDEYNNSFNNAFRNIKEIFQSNEKDDIISEFILSNSDTNDENIKTHI